MRSRSVRRVQRGIAVTTVAVCAALIVAVTGRGETAPTEAQLHVHIQGNGWVDVYGPWQLGCGGFEKDCVIEYPSGSDVGIEAHARSGSVLARWEGACSGRATVCYFKMNVPQTVVHVIFQTRPSPPHSPRCRVPRLTGMSLAKAKQTITALHCRVGHITQLFSTRAKGFVIKQSPHAGTFHARGTRVHLVVSRGRRP